MLVGSEACMSYVYAYPRIYIRKCMCTYVHTYTHTHVRITHKCICMRVFRTPPNPIHTRIRMYMHMYVYIHMHVCSRMPPKPPLAAPHTLVVDSYFSTQLNTRSRKIRKKQKKITQRKVNQIYSHVVTAHADRRSKKGKNKKN